MKFKRKLLPIIVALAIVCCLFGGIFGVDGAETQVARAEETISIYAETGESIAQGNTGYCYVYVDNTVDLASLTVAVHYDSQKMSVTGYYNQVSCSIYDASNNDGCLKFSYIFDAEGSETKTALFYFYYKINSDAEIGNTGFDVVVEEAYTTTLEVAPYSGSRCSFDITEKKIVNTCSVYGTSTINTSVEETFAIYYRLSTPYIASGSIDIKYDPELFEFVELTQGNFLNGKVVDVNSSQRGTISLSFLATEYNSYLDLIKVKFRTLKNETTTSQIQLQVNDLYNLELSPFSCSGYTTNVNVTFDNAYAEDAPSVILGASFLESTEQVLVTVLLEEGSRLGAGDFVLNFDTDGLEFVSYEKGFTPSFFNVNDKGVADGVLKFSVISMTDIVDEQTVLTILFNAKRECVNKTSNITISGTGLTDSLTNGILLNFVDTTANFPLKHTTINHEAKAPTCTEVGWNAYVTCSRCDYTTYEEKPALGHDPVEHSAKAPACTDIGWSAYVTCSRCDHTTYAEIPAIGHTPESVVVENTVDPTCTTDGSYDTVVYCGVCFEEASRESTSIPKLGHVIVSHNAQAPTCTEIGWDKYETCSRCDHTTYTEIPAKGHTESSAVVENTVAPTCIVAGGYDNVVYCSTCDAELSRDEVVVPALGHDLIPHDSKAPTCTAIGWNTYVTCSRCDHTTYQEITATGHKDANNDKLCDVCDAPLCDAHTPSENLAFDEEGHWSVCSVCGYALEKVDHTYETATTAPTCLEQGYTTFTCHCGHSYKSNFVDASGHTKASAVIENKIEPTCVNNGRYEKVVYCSICGDEVSRERVTLYATGHDIVKHNSKAPTCTAIGWNEYETCSRCDHTTYVEIAELGHKPGNTVIENMVPATCSTSGSYDSVVYCSVCGVELSRETIFVDVIGHSHTPVVTAPTCTTGGYTTYTCHCGDSYVADEVSAMGHIFSEWIVSIAPTCTGAGEERRDCDNCDYYETRELAAVEHDYSDGGSCSMCGKLSGGAVAGIATGSAGAVSVGGFSLFWFVIRKKRFKIRLKK